jgi:phasin family protein
MTNSNQFPFVFDVEKMQEMFKMPELDKMFDGGRMPGMDMKALVEAQQKNVAAMVEANKAAMAGYQELYKRQVALVQESLATAKDSFQEMQSQPMTADQATKNMEAMKSAMDKAMADLNELTEMAQQANTKAFNIIKDRFEESFAEFKDAAEKASN